MKNIKEELKNVILDVMLPEAQSYVEDLNQAIDNNNASKDELSAKKDLEAFIEELNAILKVIDENKISDKDAQVVYEKITTMIEEHEDEK